MSVFTFDRRIIETAKYPWAVDALVTPSPSVPPVPEVSMTAVVKYGVFYHGNGADAAVNVATGGTASASSEVTTSVAANAFDGDTGTYWRPSTTSDEWIEYDLGAGNEKIVDGIRIYVGSTTYAPKNIVFQAYNGTAWINLLSATVPNVIGWYDFAATNTTEYQRYRLFHKDAYSTTRIYVHELQLMSGNPPSHPDYFNSGDTVTVLTAGTLVKAGGTFVDWNTAANGSGTSYDPADTFIITTPVNLYAQWSV